MNKSIFKAGLVAMLAFVSLNEASADRAIREGQWSVSARAGIAPTLFSEDAKVTQTIVNTTAGAVTVPSGRYAITNNSRVYRNSHKFGWDDSYNLPFTAGADIGYGVMDNFEVFLNFDYLYAGGDDRKYDPITFLGRTSTIKTEFKNHNSYAGYVGGRYFFDIDSFVSPFVGAKLGFLHRSASRMTSQLSTTGIAGVSTFDVPVYKSSTGFSGGLQLGFDYGLSDVFSIVAMGEMIGSTSVKTNKDFNLVFTRPGASKSFSQVTRGPKGTLSFPITLGIKARM